MSKSISVMGTGYVGLVAGSCLAELGNDVTEIDIDDDRIQRLSGGEIPIYEPGLDRVIDNGVSNDRLRFSSDWERDLQDRDIIMIAVGTPKREDGSCDIQYVLNAAEMIGQTITSETTIVTKSTVPVGTGELIRETIQEELESRFGSLNEAPGISIVSNPEFLREGSAIEDFKDPDRVVVGSEEPSSREEVASLYQPLDTEIVKTGLRTAEMIKYASNAMLATKISFINEIANVSELVGADVTEVAEAIGLDHRINREFLNAGVGYGGSCFPKDTEALVQIAGQGGYHSQILSAVMSVNQNQRNRFAFI
ncbi:MAG: UDP-glucose/GDP-mannose dehydrogenase family protein [bacterium]